MQLRYTVVADFSNEQLAQAWLAWLRGGHIVQVLAGGATFAEIVHLDSDLQRYEVRYRFPSREAFEDYERDHAPRLRAEGAALFPPDRVKYQRTVGVVIGEFE